MNMPYQQPMMNYTPNYGAYQYNPRRLSDIEMTIAITDAINVLTSDRINGVEQFVSAWVKFVNCEIDIDTFRKMRQVVVGGVPLLIMKGGISMPIAVIISIISVAFSVFFGLFTLGLNLKNNKKSDNAELTERVKQNTRINMKLDTISSNTTEIKNEVTEMRRELNSHDNRIIKVEESVKSAHHRIDGLETRLNEDKEA